MTEPQRQPGTDAADAHFYLPAFCAPRMVLVTVLLAELVALMLTVARAGLDGAFWTDLARTSLFLQWNALGGAAALCYLRPALARLGVARGSAAALGLLLAVTLLVSEIAWWSAAQGLYTGMTPEPLLERSRIAFTLGNLAICAIVGAAVLRYLYVAHQWRRNVEREAQARVEALQARIRPHFLYNSMNTIAALTRSDPERAETAVEDLADLFRANLSETRSEVPLAEELEVARTYQRIEQLRLGARLDVAWRLDGLPPTVLVPSLLVQPLLENAIYHGIERLPDGGTVTVSGSVGPRGLELSIANPSVPGGARLARAGNRIALANVRERLELKYAGAASVTASEADGEFVVTVRLPLRDAPA